MQVLRSREAGIDYALLMSSSTHSRPVRWGILGTGRMAAVMAAELRELADRGAELVAVGSRSSSAAEGFARTFGIARAHGSHAALAADQGIDAVYVATPPVAHAANVRACLDNGKAVLCEKPFTMSSAEAREAIALARERKLFLMEAMWTRFLPAVQEARNLLRAGAIGDVQLIIAGGAFMPDYDPGYYLFSPELGGGALLDAGVYLISMSSMCLGRPQRLLSSGEVGPHGVDDHDALILEHAGGARALLYVSLRTKRAPDMEILGSDGRIHIAAPIFRPERLTVISGSREARVTELPVTGSGYGLQVLAVMAALREGRTENELMPLDETLSIMETMDEARRQWITRVD
jgi:predicted dehydrogenase